MAKIKNKRKEETTRKLTLELPDDLYIAIREQADNDIRSIAHEAQYLIVIGMDYINQLNAQHDCEEQEPQEQESCIGFKVDSDDGEDEE